MALAGIDGPDRNAPLLEVDDLATHFLTERGIVRAVDGVSFSLRPGQTLGIVGESGSGKTILARSIMGLLPPRNVIRSGSVGFGGRDLAALSDAELADVRGREIAMIFQDPMTSLNPVLRIGRQITESVRHHLGMSAKAARAWGTELLDMVGIPAPGLRMDDYPHELSGGMRQRVTIAIALACEPKLVIADEPTTALDVTVQAQILDLLQDLQASQGMALILVTHDLGVVAGRTDEIAVMYAGKIVEQARTEELFGEMRHPYTEALLRSIPRLEHDSHTRLDIIPGRPPDLVSPPPGCGFAPRCTLVQDRCRGEMPELTAGGGAGHRFRCFFPVGTEVGERARSANAADAASAGASSPGEG
jgi:peptide/nickel transport system ATP-binding protein